MQLSYALREGFLDIRRTPEYGKYSHVVTPGKHPFIWFTPMDGGPEEITDLSTMKSVIVTTDMVYRYGVMEENVVPGYDAVEIPRLLDEKA
jgi:hypothetical protein